MIIQLICIVLINYLLTSHISQNNDIAIGAALKNVSVVQKVLQRVKEKSIKTGFKKPDIIVKFFKNYIIPMTIQVELDYIFSKRE